LKKTNLFISLACALILVAIVAAPAMADNSPVTSTVGASVTISEYINATITDNGAAGIIFGTLNPGDTDQPEAAQSGSNGAISISVAKETNVVCKVGLEGSGPFSDGGSNSFALSNATWNATDTTPGTAMTTSYVQIGSDTVPGTAWSQDVWHWINIPAGQAAASYTTNFLYKVGNTL
jgi:hypothetical protein